MRLGRRTGTLGSGYIITGSSLATGGLGFVFWLLAARRFLPVEVGFSAAFLSAITFIIGVGSLGLSSAFLRYVPRSGSGWPRLVAGGYLAAAAGAAIVASIFAAIGSLNHAALSSLLDGRWLALLVTTAVVGVVFTLEDSVLIPLRRPDLVLVENAAVAVARIALLYVGLPIEPRVTIILAWLVPSLLAVVIVNGFLLVESRRRRTDEPAAARALSGIVAFCVSAAFGIAATVTMTALMPVLVTAVKGARANAGFFLPWGIYMTLQLVGGTMGSPLSAEIARGIRDEGKQTLRVIRHAVAVVAGLAVLALIAAPLVLATLGKAYHVNIPLFTLLMVGVVVGVTSSVLVAQQRAHGRSLLATATQWLGATLMIGLGIVGLNVLGLIGIGWAVLIAQGVMTTTSVVLYYRDPPTSAAPSTAVTHVSAPGEPSAIPQTTPPVAE